MSREFYMQRCIDLAGKSAGYVAPNPMVGAVLVHDNRIIGEGWHREYGQDHAEVDCVADAIRNGHEELLPFSELYVSLEPCDHFGKTPPCTELILRYKIPRVIVGCQDIFKEVDGKGIEKLRSNGVEVSISVLENECRELNRRFFLYHSQKKPYIVLKWAQSANGMIGSLNAGRTKISNDYTNRLVHRWRSEESAIMVGTGTALNDDPQLTNRLGTGPSPIRIVIDRNLRLPASLKLFDGSARTIIFNNEKEQVHGNPEYYKVDGLNEIMKSLYKLEIQSVLVEGGAQLLQSFINEGLWDELRVIQNSTMTIDNGIAAPVFNSGRLIDSFQLENDTVRVFRSIQSNVAGV